MLNPVWPAQQFVAGPWGRAVGMEQGEGAIGQVIVDRHGFLLIGEIVVSAPASQGLLGEGIRNGHRQGIETVGLVAGNHPCH